MNLCVDLCRDMRRVSVFVKLDFAFIMTFAVMDSDFGACELRDSGGTHGWRTCSRLLPKSE